MIFQGHTRNLDFFFCIILKAVAIISYFFRKQRKLLTEVLTYFMTSNRKIQGSLNFTIIVTVTFLHIYCFKILRSDSSFVSVGKKAK